MLTVTIGALARTDVVVKTTAPAADDGFGTVCLREYTGQHGRYVAVDRRHLTWQMPRDGRGLHAATVHDEPAWDEALQRWFWARLTGEAQS